MILLHGGLGTSEMFASVLPLRPGLRAAWRERYGEPHVVEVRVIERPVPAADDVLVRVGRLRLQRRW